MVVGTQGRSGRAGAQRGDSFNIKRAVRRGGSGAETTAKASSSNIHDGNDEPEMMLEAVVEVLAVCGEAADVAVFLGGSSIFWRLLAGQASKGKKLLRVRQRSRIKRAALWCVECGRGKRSSSRIDESMLTSPRPTSHPCQVRILCIDPSTRFAIKSASKSTQKARPSAS